jgi:hypothetical protein
MIRDFLPEIFRNYEQFAAGGFCKDFWTPLAEFVETGCLTEEW